MFNGFVTECLHGQQLFVSTQTCLGSVRASIQICFERNTNLMIWGLKFYLGIKDYNETFLESWLSHISTAKFLSSFSKTCADGHNITQYLKLKLSLKIPKFLVYIYLYNLWNMLVFQKLKSLTDGRVVSPPPPPYEQPIAQLSSLTILILFS